MRHIDITIDVWDATQDTMLEHGVSLLDYLGSPPDNEINRICGVLRSAGRIAHANHTLMVASDQTKTPQWWTVAVYLVDRAYGGPEEGGWWYETGELVLPPVGPDLDGIPRMWLVPRMYTAGDETSAESYLKGLSVLLDVMTSARPPIGSVLSRGRYQAVMCQGFPPAGWPQERPIYE